MKGKNTKIYIIVFVVLLVLVVILGVTQKNKKLGASGEAIIDYEVIESSGDMFKGQSIVSEEQVIFLDAMLTLEETHIENKQKVKKDDVIITYFNEVVEEQIDGLQIQKDSINTQIVRLNSSKVEITSKISEKEKLIDEYDKKLETLVNIEQVDEKLELEQKILVERQELELLRANLNGEEDAKTILDDNIKDLNSQIEKLKEKLREEVKATLDGIVYINKEGLTNPAMGYINIVSEEPLIKSSANEYDILNLESGQEVKIKVLSTGEEMTGTIDTIDDLPTASIDGTSVNYNFTVKPEKSIRVGFSVEIKENIKTLEIPIEYVEDNNGKLTVKKVSGDTIEEIEVTGELDGSYYTITSDKIKPGNNLRIPTLEESEEE